MDTQLIQIQATFTGYGGKSCTLFSAYDTSARILVVGVEAAYRMQRRDSCIVLTNDPNLNHDWFFSDADDLMPAISAFYALKTGVATDGRSGRLAFDDRAARANPAQSIERDGLDANGPKYRVDEQITCAQVATLATCLYATRIGTVEQTIQMADSLYKLLCAGDGITI